MLSVTHVLQGNACNQSLSTVIKNNQESKKIQASVGCVCVKPETEHFLKQLLNVNFIVNFIVKKSPR